MPVRPAPAPRTTASPDAHVPLLRLVAPPATEPPYDDEAGPHALPSTGRPVLRAVGGAAPLRSVPAERGPARDVPASVPLRLVPAEQDGDDDASPASDRTALEALAPVRPFAQALVQRLLEVLGGVRPVSQLQRDTTPELFARLERHVLAHPQARGARLTTTAVRSVHVQARPEGVAEACATVRRGPRMHALALRLEGVGGRWCCTDLQGLRLP